MNIEKRNKVLGIIYRELKDSKDYKWSAGLVAFQLSEQIMEVLEK